MIAPWDIKFPHIFTYRFGPFLLLAWLFLAVIGRTENGCKLGQRGGEDG